MNVMIYFYKKDFEVQKAERWFKERGVKTQAVDMKKNAPGIKEIRLFAQKVGLSNLPEKTGKAWLESTARFLNGEQALIQALSDNPQLLRSPIVREGQKVTAGYAPEAWAAWLE